MIDAPSRPARNPYLMEEQPTSCGRIFLARAFEHYCMFQEGYSARDISAAFRGEGPAIDRAYVRMAARLLGEAFARSILRSWARPIGGGDPVELRAGMWELDDFDRRFATGAIDPKFPFDANAEPTCWLFVDVDEWNALIEATFGEEIGPARHRPHSPRTGPGGSAAPRPGPQTPAAVTRQPTDAGRLVRLPEVRMRTGLSRSTIYRRMTEGRFPQQVDMRGSIAAWREDELAEWIENPS